MLAGVAVAVTASTAHAQLITSAPGTISGLFGGRAAPDPRRSTQKLTVTADASGGQDTLPSESQSPTDPAPRIVRNTATTAAAAAQYSAGRAGRLFELSGGGFVNRETIRDDQLRGANAQVRGSFGTRNGLSLMASTSYQPLTIQSTGIVPDTTIATPASGQSAVAPPNAVITQEWLSTQTGATVFRNFSPRRRLEGGVTAFDWRPIEGSGLRSSSARATAQLINRVAPQRTVRLRYSGDLNHQSGIARFESDTTMHSPAVGLQWQKRYSPRRSLATDIEGGITRVSFSSVSDTGTATVAVGAAQLELTTSERFRVGASVRRDVTVLNGFTNLPFASMQVGAQVNGMIARRVTAHASTTYMRGTALVASGSGFDNVVHSLRLQYGMAAWCGIFAGYSYYQQSFDQLQSPVEAVLTSAGRHAVRVGVTLWLPLYGTF